MPNLFPKKPFYKQYEISASLANNSKSLDNLHVFIEYPQHIPGIIKGYILGGKSESTNLSAFMDSAKGYCQLKSVDYENCRQSFESSTVIIRSIHKRTWPKEYSNSMTDIVAVLEMNDLIINDDITGGQYTQDNETKREITFFLAGPSIFWPTFGERTVSYTGEVDISPRNIEIELGELFHGKIIRKPWFFHSTTLIDGNEVDTRLVEILRRVTRPHDDSS